MNLIQIKKKSAEKEISITRLADKVGMSSQNLHKCIRDNRIEASDLEKIAKVLESSILLFFDEEISASEVRFSKKSPS